MGIEPNAPRRQPTVSQRNVLSVGTIWDQKRGQLFNCIAMRSLDEMRINAQSRSRVRMTELTLRHFWRSATFEEQRCVCMRESMEPSPRDLQGIEQRPEMVLDDLLGSVRTGSAIAEKQPERIELPRI
jgi:hypothetical protein